MRIAIHPLTWRGGVKDKCKLATELQRAGNEEIHSKATGATPNS
jgi:hypothetical protein